MSATQIDIIRSLVKGSHARGATHAAANQTTPTITTDVEPIVNQVSDLAEEERDGVKSGANGSENKTLGTTGDFEGDMTVESTHPSTEGRSESSTIGASGTAELSAVQQHFATGSVMLTDMLKHIITQYPLVAGLKTLFDVVHAWHPGIFGNWFFFPASGPAEVWLRIVLRFGIGFVLVRYRKDVERYMDHIRIVLASLCMCVVGLDVGSGNVGWKTIFMTGAAVPLLMYQAVVQREVGRPVIMR